MAQLSRDEWGVVFNSPETFEALADRLSGRKEKPSTTPGEAQAFGWTDQQGSHMDVLLALPNETGPFNRTDSRYGKLWIGVAGYGLWAVPSGDLDPGYVASKLGFGYPNATVIKLAELINGVTTALNGVKT